MRKASRVPLAAALLVLAATPALAQDQGWQNRWFWGAQTGVYVFQTPTQNWSSAFEVGGHWLITRSRVGLHLAIDQIFFSTGTTSEVVNGLSPTGSTVVAFDNGQRLQASLYAIPMNTQLQVLVGGGFAIHRISDAVPIGATTQLEEQSAIAAINEADTKAFVVVGAGLQWRVGRWAVFGNYQFMPGTENFLVTSDQHAVTGGLRYALTRSSEEIGTRRSN